MKDGELQRRFEYHAPDARKAAKHQLLRGLFMDTASVIEEQCPEGREKSLAITKLEESLMWANAAIARGDSA